MASVSRWMELALSHTLRCHSASLLLTARQFALDRRKAEWARIDQKANNLP